MLDKLMEFLESAAVGEEYYVLAPSESDRAREIRLTRGNGRRSWSTRPYGSEDPWRTVDREGLIAVLGGDRQLLAELQEHLLSSVLNHAVFAHMITRSVVELLGDDAVGAALEAHENFAKTLCSTIDRCVGRHQVVQGGGHQTPAKRGHLRLVTSRPRAARAMRGNVTPLHPIPPASS